eukprot:4486195-Pleurochrysis_carterae.AAC.2
MDRARAPLSGVDGHHGDDDRLALARLDLQDHRALVKVAKALVAPLEKLGENEHRADLRARAERTEGHWAALSHEGDGGLLGPIINVWLASSRPCASPEISLRPSTEGCRACATGKALALLTCV